MDEGHYRKRLMTVVGVLSGALAVGLLVVTLAPGGLALVGGPTSILGWIIPLVSLFVIVAITWLVIARDFRQNSDEGAHYVSCWSCGHSVQREWRLCPYCGAEFRTWSAPDTSLHQN